MWKIIGLGMILSGSIGTGFAFGRQLTQRQKELQALEKMFVMLKGEISYGITPLGEAMKIIGKRMEEPFRSFFCRMASDVYTKQAESLAQLFTTRVEEDLQNTVLMEKDKDALKQLGSFLGYLDKHMQLRTIDLYLAELKQEIQMCHVENPVKKKLYQSLGIMGGLFLVILLI